MSKPPLVRSSAVGDYQGPLPYSSTSSEKVLFGGVYIAWECPFIFLHLINSSPPKPASFRIDAVKSFAATEIFD